MIKKLKSSFQSEMVKNGATLLSASTISQAIALIIYPIITRQYSPEELGALSLFLSIVGIGTILASGKYETAIMIEKKKENAGSVFDLTFLLTIAFTLFSFILILLFKPWIISTFQLESITAFISLVPILIFLSSIGYTLTYWFNRNKRFALTARYNIVQSATSSALKVGFGTIGITQWGLIASSIIGQLFGVISVLFKKKDFDKLITFPKEGMKQMAKKHADFPKFTLPHAFINTLAGNAPVMLLAAYFGLFEVGLFTLGLTIAFKPIQLVTTSINQILFQKVTQNKAEGINSFHLLATFCQKVLLVGIPSILIIYLILPPATELIFGGKWIKAGEYTQLMLPWFLAVSMGSSLSFMPAVVNKQLTAMIIEICYAVSRISVLFIGIWQKDIKLAILLYSIVNTIFVGGQVSWHLQLAKKDQ